KIPGGLRITDFEDGDSRDASRQELRRRVTMASAPTSDQGLHGDAPAGADRDLLRKIQSGTRIWLMRGAAARAISTPTNLLLIALVSPAEFGVLAVIRGMVSLVYFVSDLGSEAAMVRRRVAPTTQEMSALVGFRLLVLSAIVFGFWLITGAGTGVGMLAPELDGRLVALFAVFLVTPLQLAGRVRIERALDFGKLGFIEVSTILVE